jgi:hypothetical protein
MHADPGYRQITLPDPTGNGPGGDSGSDSASWSARRTTVTVVALLMTVVGVAWWMSPDADTELRWRDAEGQKRKVGLAGDSVDSPVYNRPVDLESTEKALEALSGWEQKSWSKKREALPVIDRVMKFGGVHYPAYIDANHAVIREHLQVRQQSELTRREVVRGTTDER